MPHARLQRLRREGTRGAARGATGGGRRGHGTPHTRTRTRTHRQVHARTHGHTTHARTLDCTHRTHAAVCACGSGDHDGGCGRRLGARVAAAASVAAVMGGRRRGRHGRVWHGRMRCGTGVAAVATVEVAGSPAATAVEVTVAARSATATTDAARRPGRDVLLLDTCGNG